MRILLVVYDNDSYTHIFPMGMGYIAAVLEEAGHDVDIYSQDYHHYPDDHLRQFLDANVYDFVGVSLIAGYYQYRKLLKISDAINASKNRPIYAIGGYGPTPEPEFFLRKTGADIIVQGEGEITAVELLEALANKSPLANVKGIAFREGENVIVNERRGQIEDLDTIPWPAYHKFPIEYYRMAREAGAVPTDFYLPMMSARGCTFKCTFCYRMDTGYRARNPENIIEEIRYLNKDFGINYISFQDDLLMSSVAHTEEVCRAFMNSGLDVKWNCNGRLNYCTPELIKMMKKAGCVFINYGIEAMDNDVLKKMKKGLRTDQIINGIEMTIAEGIHPGLNMMFGNLGDTPETLQKAVDFLLKYDDFGQMRTIRPVTPYPGSPLYYRAIEEGLLEGVEDFYENKHLNSDLLAVNFTDMTDEEFYDCLTKANTSLLNNYYNSARDSALDTVNNLYKNKNTAFRGFRQI